jgi:predicted HicB family RNase H-like nuclease
VTARERSCVSEHPARPHTWRNEMNGRIQIVGRLPVALNRRVRAAAKRRKVSLNAFLIEALTQALGPRRVAQTKGA